MSEEKKRFNFLSGIIGELKKVTWLTWGEALRLTTMVLGVAIVVGLVLGGLDFGFTAFIEKIVIGG
ncbi:MAG: preprotein translocase subunit SecE [Dehalococcoidia bacterium]|nr:preprotein translocase subunit SecE [Dehalococcoidia bacterium]